MVFGVLTLIPGCSLTQDSPFYEVLDDLLNCPDRAFLDPYKP